MSKTLLPSKYKEHCVHWNSSVSSMIYIVPEETCHVSERPSVLESQKSLLLFIVDCAKHNNFYILEIGNRAFQYLVSYTPLRR